MKSFIQFIAEAKDNWHTRNDHDGGYGSTIATIGKNLGKHQVRQDHDAETLMKYTSMSRVLNGVLHSHSKGRTDDRNHGFNVDHVDAAVERNSLKHDLDVYHGAHGDPGKEAAKHPEGHIHQAVFTSTSIDKKRARGFAWENGNGYVSHVLHIKLKAGQKGAYVGKDKDNINSHQHEFILPRNTTLKIHKTEETVHQNRTYHIHHATVVDNK